MRVVAIIPSRLKSMRVPNKALIDIEGLPMIVHVYHRVKMQKMLDDVIVATDSKIIKNIVEKYGSYMSGLCPKNWIFQIWPLKKLCL